MDELASCPGTVFEQFFESSPTGMAVLGVDGLSIAVNPALCRFLGYAEPDLPRDLGSVMHIEDAGEQLRLRGEMLAGRLAQYQCNVRWLHATGRVLWTSLAATLAHDRRTIMVQIQDVTASKETESELRRAEALFRTIGENAGDLIFVVEFPKLTFEYVSPTFHSVLGYSIPELLRTDSLSLVHPEDRPTIHQAIARMMDGGLDSSIDLVRFLDASGGFRHVEVHGCAVRNEDGEIERTVVVGRIVDDRIAAQQKLFAREQELQLLLDSTAEGIFGVDTDGFCSFCNKACLAMLGFNRISDVLHKPILDRIHGQVEDGASCEGESSRSRAEFRSGRAIHSDNSRFWRSDGTSFPVEYWSHPMLHDGRLVGSVVAFIDISKRRGAEAELVESHREAQAFINAVPSILIGLDPKGCIKRWNLAAAQTFELTGHKVLGKPLSRCGIRWLTPDIDRIIETLLRKGRRTRCDSLSFRRNTSVRHLGMTADWITFPHDGKGELLLVGADITERQIAENDLRSKTAFLEAQVQATIDGMLLVDEEGKVALLNARFLEMFEVPVPVKIGFKDEYLLPYALAQVEDKNEFLARVQHLYEHKHETSREEIRFRNGKVLDRYSSPVIGSDGKYYGRIWTFRDITARQKNEDALRQLSVAVEQSPVSVVITDLQGNITYVNRRFTECTGYDYAEVIGRNPRVLKSEQTPPGVYQQLWETITKGQEWRGELRNRKKNGDVYWESIVISPIRNSAGETSHFLAVKEDITEHKIAESHSRQTQKLEAIGQLAAGIAHEINTPIQFVGDNTRFIKDAWSALDAAIGLCESACAGTVPADFLDQLRKLLAESDSEYLRSEVPRALDQSLEGIQRVAKIVQAMKEFSHPGADEKQLADINKAILTTLTVARNEWKYVAEVETVLAEPMELVPCHIGELNQVFLNLLINAAHAIAEVAGDGSKGKGKITVRTSQDQQFTTISLQDTGAGIRPEIQSKVFDPFFTTKGVGRGTGQGLSLAHSSIVKKHGGKIWFETVPGKGTTFFIQLPMAGRMPS